MTPSFAALAPKRFNLFRRLDLSLSADGSLGRESEGDVVVEEVCGGATSSEMVVRVGAAPGGFKGAVDGLMRMKPVRKKLSGSVFE